MQAIKIDDMRICAQRKCLNAENPRVITARARILRIGHNSLGVSMPKCECEKNKIQRQMVVWDPGISRVSWSIVQSRRAIKKKEEAYTIHTTYCTENQSTRIYVHTVIFCSITQVHTHD